MLLAEDKKWEWCRSCDTAFNKLKDILTSSPVLANPDPHRPYTVHTDYSHTAIGAILEQLHSDGKQHVVAYASRTCSKAESQLGPTDGELLAIVYAVDKFHHHLAGTSFTIVTDHSALTHLNTSKAANPKLARWAMRLAAYSFTLQHRAGRIHNNADGLSRSRAEPSPDTPPPDHVAIETATPVGPQDCPFALHAALEALDSALYADGEPPPLFCDDATSAPLLGPR